MSKTPPPLPPQVSIPSKPEPKSPLDIKKGDLVADPFETNDYSKSWEVIEAITYGEKKNKYPFRKFKLKRGSLIMEKIVPDQEHILSFPKLKGWTTLYEQKQSSFLHDLQCVFILFLIILLLVISWIYVYPSIMHSNTNTNHIPASMFLPPYK